MEVIRSLSHRGQVESKRWAPAIAIGAALLLLLALTAALGREASELLSAHRAGSRGVVYGDPPQIPLTDLYPLGVNASLHGFRSQELDPVLELLQSEGAFRWIRQTFPWSAIEPEQGGFEWELWDEIVRRATAAGFRLIAVLDSSPRWARASFDADNPQAPPEDFEHYFRFVAAVGSRYGARIDHYQIWDQPNIYPHWGERSVDPAAYENLLRGAYHSIRSIDPEAVILSAGLAPNAEPGGRNMSDLTFLQMMYDAGAAGAFDVLAVKPYGFWTGPEDRRVAAEVTNFSRAILAREVMVRNGDGGKPVWAVEMGWNSLPADWSGAPPPWGSDAGVLQAERTVGALERALVEWPWMGVLLLERLDPFLAEDDPRRGFALLGEDLRPRTTYRMVRSWIGDGLPLFPGRYGPDAWAVESVGGAYRFSFIGTRLELLGSGLTAQTILDGREPATMSSGRIQAASGLADGLHRAEVFLDEGELDTIVIARDSGLLAGQFGLGILGAAIAAVGIAGVRVAGSDDLRRAGRILSTRIRSLAEPAQGALVFFPALLLHVSPWLPVDLVLVAWLWAGVTLRPDWGLAAVSFSLPFFLWGEGAVGGSSSVTEILVVLIAAGAVARWAGQGHRSWSFRAVARGLAGPLGWGREGGRYRRAAADAGVLGLVALGGVSLLWSSHLGVAVREFRVVIVESALLYFLVRLHVDDETKIWRLMDGLVAGAAAVSLVGLAQWVSGQNLIEADGVLRIRATYGSPNNLALYLGRIVPIALAVVWLRPSNRAVSYLLSLAPIASAAMLTFSRGFWLLGLPASVLFLGAAMGRRGFTRAAAALAILLLATMLILGGQRFVSFADPQAETTVRRLALWRASAHMVQDHPITGVGLDNFLYQYPRYLLPEGRAEPGLSHPHNFLLHWWLSLGLLGLPLLLWIVTAFLRSGLRAFRSTSRAGPRALAMGILGSLVYGFAHGLIDQSFFLVDLAFAFMIGFAVTVQLENLAAPPLD